ncbi:MAG: hypothetical protein GY835_03175 [bacterium]|nr:hypothetical protein [bacterium]
MTVPTVHHFLFGSINLKDEPGKIEPASRELLVALQRLMSGADSGAHSLRLFDKTGSTGSGRDAFAECARWASQDIRDEVGWISFPLDLTVAGESKEFQVLCRMYHSWASGNRPSATGHAYVLTGEEWEKIDFNPFRIPNFYETSARFQQMGKLADEGLPTSIRESRKDPWARLQEIRRSVQAEGRQIPEVEISRWLQQILGQYPVRLPEDAEQWLFELLVLLLPVHQRRRLAFWSGAFGVTAEYEEYFVLGRGRGGAETAQGFSAAGEARGTDVGRLLHDEQVYRDFVRQDDREKISDSGRPALTQKIKAGLSAGMEFPSGYPGKSEPPGAVPDSATVPDPAVAPAAEEPFRKPRLLPWKRIAAVLVVSALVVWALFFFWRGEPEESGAEEWIRRFEEMSMPGDAFGLFVEGREILRTVPPDGETAAQMNQRLVRLKGKMHAYLGDMIGKETQREIWDALERVYAVHNAPPAEEPDLRFATDGLIDTLRDRESWLITRHDASAIEERRRSLEHLEEYYDGGSPVLRPANLENLRASTRRIEARLAFDELKREWQTIREDNLAEALPLLVREIAAYRGDFNEVFYPEELDRFEKNLYTNYERFLRSPLSQSYTGMKSDLTLEHYRELEKAVDDYHVALQSLPATPAIDRFKKVKDVFRDLSRNPRLRYKRSKGSARIGYRRSRKGRCITTSGDKLRLDDLLEAEDARVCVVWRYKDEEDEETHDFNVNEIGRRGSRRLFELYWSWPDFR